MCIIKDVVIAICRVGEKISPLLVRPVTNVSRKFSQRPSQATPYIY